MEPQVLLTGPPEGLQVLLILSHSAPTFVYISSRKTWQIAFSLMVILGIEAFEGTPKKHPWRWLKVTACWKKNALRNFDCECKVLRSGAFWGEWKFRRFEPKDNFLPPVWCFLRAEPFWSKMLIRTVRPKIPVHITTRCFSQNELTCSLLDLQVNRSYVQQVNGILHKNFVFVSLVIFFQTGCFFVLLCLVVSLSHNEKKNTFVWRRWTLLCSACFAVCFKMVFISGVLFVEMPSDFVLRGNVWFFVSRQQCFILHVSCVKVVFFPILFSESSVRLQTRPHTENFCLFTLLYLVVSSFAVTNFCCTVVYNVPQALSFLLLLDVSSGRISCYNVCWPHLPCTKSRTGFPHRTWLLQQTSAAFSDNLLITWDDPWRH